MKPTELPPGLPELPAQYEWRAHLAQTVSRSVSQPLPGPVLDPERSRLVVGIYKTDSNHWYWRSQVGNSPGSYGTYWWSGPGTRGESHLDIQGAVSMVTS